MYKGLVTSSYKDRKMSAKFTLLGHLMRQSYTYFFFFILF